MKKPAIKKTKKTINKKDRITKQLSTIAAIEKILANILKTLSREVAGFTLFIKDNATTPITKGATAKARKSPA